MARRSTRHHIDLTRLLKFRKLSGLLSAGAYLRVSDSPNVANPHARYPHPKSLPSGKGLTFALAGSISGVSRMRNLSRLIDLTKLTICHTFRIGTLFDLHLAVRITGRPFCLNDDLRFGAGCSVNVRQH